MSYNMYSEMILELYKNPKNFGELKRVTNCATKKNLLCGDELTINLELSEGRVKNVSFLGEGCAISRASASLVTDEIKGKELREISKINSEDVKDFLGIPISPGRERCALLILEALKEAIKNA